MISKPRSALIDPFELPLTYTRLLSTHITPEKLTGEITVDAVVIGAGITGCSTALHLAKAGKSVAQLEADVISSGGSGRAFGLVVPYGKHSEKKVFARMGQKQGQLHIDSLAAGPALVKSLIDKHSMEGADTGAGWILAPHIPQAIAALRARVNYWQSRGADVEFLSGEDAQNITGSSRYSDVMLDMRALTINPLAYTRGLARAAREVGVAQFPHSPANNIQRRGGGWLVQTPEGQVHADMVFICTNAYSAGLWPKLQKAFVRIRGHQAVTVPLSDEALRQILPGASVITDTRHTWSGLKKLPCGRLHLSAGGPAISGQSRANLNSVKNRLKELYPNLADTEWESDWSGWVAMTPDQLPAIARLGDGIWAGYGYNGRGLACATLMGRELAALASGTEHEPFVAIKDFRPLPLHFFGKYAAATAIHWYRAIDWLNLKKFR